MLALPAAGFAQTIVANFANGGQAGQVDAYAGTAGLGWSGAWSVAETTPLTAGAIAGSASIVTSSPLASGGGDDLQLTASTNSAFTNASAGYAAVFRTWDGTTVNAAAAHQVSFEFQPNSTLASGETFAIFSNSLGVSPGSATAWEVIGTTTGWEFVNGTKAIGIASLSQSSMAVTAGTTYTFTITVNPTTQSWIGSVSNGTTSYTTGTLGFYGNKTTDGTTLDFASTFTAASQSSQFSIDSIAISAVPEPSIALLLLIGGAAAGAARMLSASRMFGVAKTV